MKKKSTDNYVEGKKIKQMKNTIKHYDFSNKLSIRKIKKMWKFEQKSRTALCTRGFVHFIMSQIF